MVDAARPLKRPKTWEDLDEVPEGYRGEIIDGEIVSTPRPDAPHVEASGELLVELVVPFRRGRGGPGGWVILMEPGLQLGEQMRIPDLAGWKAERFARPERGPYTAVPDWVCEILSPATAKTDRFDKMPLYARHGIQHLWLVDPVTRTLEVFRREGGLWLLLATVVGGTDTDCHVRAEPFDAVELDFTQVWGAAPQATPLNAQVPPR